MRSTIVIMAILVSACSQADSRVDNYLEIMEDSLNTTSLFYKRLSPEAAKMIKPVVMPSEAREVAECVVKTAKQEGIIDLFDESMKQSRKFMDYIIDTPELTILTLEQDKAFNEIQNEMGSSKYDPLTKINKDCGVIAMNIKATNSIGVMDAMRTVMTQ